MASDDHTDHEASPVSPVDVWLRRHLGRRLTVALVAYGPLDEATRCLADGLAAHEEIRVLVLPAEHAPGSEWLAQLAGLDPEIVLVAEGAGAGATPDARGDEQKDDDRLRALLDDLEQGGIRDRAFVALVGANVTREQARRLGFEDGFAAGTPLHTLAAILAREGAAVDERRQRGSSPPCYL